MLPFLLVFGIALAFANFQTVQLTTIVLHRCLTHGALQLRPWFLTVAKFDLWTHTTIVFKQWVGIHRHHHAKADDEGDPHSPWIFGFWTVQFWNVALYSDATKDVAMIERHTRNDLPYTKMDLLFFNKGWLGLLLGSAIYYFFGSFLGHGFAAVLGMWSSGFLYVFGESSSVNGLGHYPSRIGRRNYEDEHAAKSQNLYIPGLQPVVTHLLGGEENHNNHHKDPKSAYFAHYPERGERDSGAFWIRFLVWLRIASKVHTPQVWEETKPAA
jgi:stearoyl-CoA desaturase (delta-9 desaturase)